MPKPPNRAFAEALDAAIVQRQFTTRELAKRLHERGITIPSSKLANWRTGRSIPRLRNTQEAVTILEKVLGLSAGDLSIPLRADLLADHAAANGMAPRPSLTEPENTNRAIDWKFSSLDRSANWDGEVYREVMEEEITVSADFLRIYSKISLVVRYGSNPLPTLHVSAFWDTADWPDESDIGVYNIEGATVGTVREEIHDEGISRIATLHLPTNVPEGELRHVYYEQGYTSQKPLDIAVMRAFSWPIYLYTGRVIFEGDVPDNIQWILTRMDKTGVEKTIRTRTLVPNGATVQTSSENLENATGIFRWSPPYGGEPTPIK